MYYIRYPLSFRQVEDILHGRGIDICHETVRFWVNRFGAKFDVVRQSLTRLKVPRSHKSMKRGFETTQ